MNATRRGLVIDDDDISRELLASTLREGGFKVFELPSPIGATQLLVREALPLLILDLQMPDMSGDKLARLLRKNHRLHSLAILLVSGGDERDLHRIATEVAADGVVLKRNVRDGLLSAVNRVLLSRASRG
ncbi:MAG TPA: response regulator [Acidimicrobiales bacterium]|nr:response regulator [Acidimicrobiales bacterium]